MVDFGHREARWLDGRRDNSIIAGEKENERRGGVPSSFVCLRTWRVERGRLSAIQKNACLAAHRHKKF